jgi:hypothetical protein
MSDAILEGYHGAALSLSLPAITAALLVFTRASWGNGWLGKGAPDASHRGCEPVLATRIATSPER